MLWTDKIKLIISLSLLLIIIPCLLAYSFKQLPQGVSIQVGILASGLDVLAAEIVILLLLALYFACCERKTILPSAVAFSRCSMARYQTYSTAATHYSSRAARDDKEIIKQNQSIAWQIMSKQELIFK